MTKTDYQAASTSVDDVQEAGSKRPNRSRRILLITAAVIAVLGLVALMFGGAIFNPAATSGTEPTLTATQIIPLVILVVLFVVATKWPMKLGCMGLVRR